MSASDPEFERLTKELESLRKQFCIIQESAKVGEAALTMLSSSEKKYRDLFENAIDPIFIVDRDMRYVDVNHRATEAFGYTREEFLSMSILDVIPPEQVERSRIEFSKLLTNGSYEHFEGRMRIKNGEWRDIEVSSSAIYEGTDVVGAQDIVRDITQRKLFEQKLRETIWEKDILMREMSHRVKNNLQIISSLLSIQSMAAHDERTASILMDTESRVRSMSMIHEKLYRSNDLRHINFSEYLHDLTTELFDSYNVSQEVRLDLDLPQTTLDVDLVISCGIIVNELVTNALKYAFPEKAGTITVSFQKTPDGICTLTVKDNGKGAEQGHDFREESAASIGMRLVKASSQKLKASLTVEHAGGMSYTFSFKEQTPEMEASPHTVS